MNNFNSSNVSKTVLVIVPAVSWVKEIGIMPVLLIIPTVGFKPTKELLFEGDKIEFDVSVPIESNEKSVSITTAVPELEPPVSKIP